jgi:Arc/MetJ-type ribon-helix-helix transcriptional regulator
MKYAKIAVSVPAPLLAKVDRLVKSRHLPSRSFAIQKAIESELERIDKTSLAYACDQLDPTEEQKLAEEGNEDFSEWPQY